MIWALPFLLALALVALLTVPAQSPFHTIVQASDDDTESVPGPCEDGYVAPTPVDVPVTSVPITVTSTTADYFVLYIKISNVTRLSMPHILTSPPLQCPLRWERTARRPSPTTLRHWRLTSMQ